MSDISHIMIGGKDALDLDVIRLLQLKFRIAVVFSTFDPGWFNRIEAFGLDLLEAVSTCLRAAEVHIGDDADHSVLYRSIHEFESNRPNQTDVEGDIHIPLFSSFRRDHSTLGVMTCELWDNVGGPWPYHDSYTFAVYLQNTDQRDRILNAVLEICAKIQDAKPEVVSE